MSWSGGTYSKGNAGTGGWVGDASLGIGIEAGRHDTQDNDFATGINNCLAKDGQNAMTANLNFGGFLPTNVGAGTAAAPAICAGNDVNTGMYSPGADQIGFATNGVERVTINSSGGVSLSQAGSSPVAQFSLLQYSNDNQTSQLQFYKSKAASLGGNTIVANGDQIGMLRFFGANGTSYQEGARITATIDGTPGATNDMPTMLQFFTAPDPGASVTERLRIRADGNFGINQGGGATVKLGITADTADSTANVIQTVNSAATELLRIRNDGLFNTGVAASSPFNSTTATAANLVVQSTGQLQRSTSSLRYKTDVADYDKGMEAVNALRPVYYKGINDGDKQFAGFIAEEVDAAGLNEFVIYNDNGEPDALAYGNMLAVAVKAIQELNAKVEALEAKVENLEAVTAGL